MPMKASGPARPEEIDRWDGGVGWIAYPDEWMQRAGHALAVGGAVWVVDPVDYDGLDRLLADLGEVAGVVVLLDRHARDAAAVARRHGVAVHLPGPTSGIADRLDAPVEPLGRELGETGYRACEVLDVPGWRETALYDESGGTLVVADALGTAEYFLAGGERLGVHPLLRPVPPRRLGRCDPERVLVGHGAGVHEDAAGALADALAGARRRALRLYAKTVRALVS